MPVPRRVTSRQRRFARVYSCRSHDELRAGSGDSQEYTHAGPTSYEPAAAIRIHTVVHTLNGLTPVAGVPTVAVMLKETLTADLVTTDLPGSDKDQVIRALVDLAATSRLVKDPELALDDVIARERTGSTGMENGIAIPHAKTDAVDRLVAVVGISRGKIDFASLDGKPSRIFVLLLSPRDGTGPHIQFLAEISRMLKEEKVRRKLIRAKAATEVVSALVPPQ